VIELVGVGLVAGLVAGISPCILPVLPIVLATGAAAPGSRRDRWSKRSRPVAVVGGLIVSFSLLILFGSEVLSALHLPQDLLRDAGIALLVAVGLSLLIPPLATVLDRPFARLRLRQPTGRASGFVMGLALGPLFVPCAGPVLAAITVVGATHRVGWSAVFVTLAFAVGVSIPLLIVALAGTSLIPKVRALRQHGPALRALSGVVLVAMALAIGLNAFDGLQRAVPGYTDALQNRVEGSATVRQELGSLTGTDHGSLAHCSPSTPGLVDCGAAPGFADITTWLNTPGGRPLSLASLRGKVVLVDFWTYSCINCQRTLPHVEAWSKAYAADGLVVVGVHTPEFAFEHVVTNVRAESAQLGVTYPVAVDNRDGTWDAYDNEYWPADYLIDARGEVRHVTFGEGDYATTETLIRQLLVDAHPGAVLPPPTEVANKTPTNPTNPETYVGYQQLQYLVPSQQIRQNQATLYQLPASLPLGALAFGGTWTEHAQEATAGADAQLELGYQADDVYLVLGGTGTLRVTVNGAHTQTIDVSGPPRLYAMVQSDRLGTGTLVLDAEPGIEAYDFTFG
jgi:cytochrome c biogenesis protein CcdA/thiol-disulfide isomerase/thioredoxin